MKICLCVTRLKKDLSEAISKNFYNLSEELVRQGHEVTILSPVKIDAPTHSNVIIYSEDHNYRSKSMVLKNIKNIAKFINKNHFKFDTIHYHVGFLIEAYLLGKELKKTKIPSFVTVWQSHLKMGEFSKILHFAILKPKDYLYHFILNSFLITPFLKKEITKKYNKVIVSSEYQKNQIKDANVSAAPR